MATKTSMKTTSWDGGTHTVAVLVEDTGGANIRSTDTVSVTIDWDTSQLQIANGGVDPNEPKSTNPSPLDGVSTPGGRIVWGNRPVGDREEYAVRLACQNADSECRVDGSIEIHSDQMTRVVNYFVGVICPPT